MACALAVFLPSKPLGGDRTGIVKQSCAMARTSGANVIALECRRVPTIAVR
jgi:hypothetical protein